MGGACRGEEKLRRYVDDADEPAVRRRPAAHEHTRRPTREALRVVVGWWACLMSATLRKKDSLRPSLRHEDEPPLDLALCLRRLFTKLADARVLNTIAHFEV